jgi:hypothetical protein
MTITIGAILVGIILGGLAVYYVIGRQAGKR